MISHFELRAEALGLLLIMVFRMVAEFAIVIELLTIRSCMFSLLSSTISASSSSEIGASKLNSYPVYFSYLVMTFSHWSVMLSTRVCTFMRARLISVAM